MSVSTPREVTGPWASNAPIRPPAIATQPVHRRAARGFTLVEVLVAILLLSVGLLGVAGLQISGLRYHQGAYMRGQATSLLYDMTDRMRINPQGVGAGSYNAITINTTTSGWQSSLPADPDCAANNCTPANQAALDIRQWGLALGQLPRAVGTVTRNGLIFTLTITWQDLDSNAEAPANQTASLNVQINNPPPL
ncbi:MAG: type IV pilus modification protein PilV [Candidatus Macondimonas sp.]|jgi:type IV pilus assembly protein PilV